MEFTLGHLLSDFSLEETEAENLPPYPGEEHHPSAKGKWPSHHQTADSGGSQGPALCLVKEPPHPLADFFGMQVDPKLINDCLHPRLSSGP